MRVLPWSVLLFPPCAAFAQAQVIDGAYPRMRAALNARVNVVDPNGWDRFRMENSEPMRDYALEEPWTWAKRMYFRIDPTENPELDAVTDAIGSRSIAAIVNSALDSGMVTQFKDLSFTFPLLVSEQSRLDRSSVILKVDFTYNDTTHTLRSHIIGFSFEQAGGDLVDYYYPELRYVLEKCRIKTAHGTVTVSEYFERWMFIAHPVERETVEKQQVRMYFDQFFERQSEFDALTGLFLIEREIDNRKVIRRGKRSMHVTSYEARERSATVHFTGQGGISRIVVRKGKAQLLIANYVDGRPHGAFREFYGDGSLKQQGQFEEGLRSGQWASWWENGNIRSRRVYEGGRLQGTQRVYYDNGQLMLEYDMVRGEYEGMHAAYYSDGRVKMKGPMKGGFVDGEWDYSLRITDTLKHHMDERPGLFDFPPGAWQDNQLDYHITYHQTGKDDPSCPLRPCIDVVWPKEVK